MKEGNFGGRGKVADGRAAAAARLDRLLGIGIVVFRWPMLCYRLSVVACLLQLQLQLLQGREWLLLCACSCAASELAVCELLGGYRACRRQPNKKKKQAHKKKQNVASSALLARLQVLIALPCPALPEQQQKGLSPRHSLLSTFPTPPFPQEKAQ